MRASERERRARMSFNRTRPPADVDVDAGISMDEMKTLTMYDDGVDVYVDVSTISGAGYGLFAKRRLRAGDVVTGATYGGDVLSLAETLRMAHEDKEYVMALHFNVHVCAKRHLGYLARFVNDVVGTLFERNCKFEKDVARRRATLRVLKDIEVGDELFAEYGAGYWRARHATT